MSELLSKVVFVEKIVFLRGQFGSKFDLLLRNPYVYMYIKMTLHTKSISI